MKKWCAAIMLAVFALLAVFMGSGQPVYATEEGYQGDPVYDAHFDFGDEIRLLPYWGHYFNRFGDGRWYVENTDYPDGTEFPVEITDISFREGADSSIRLEAQDGGWNIETEPGANGEAAGEATAVITYGIDAENIPEDVSSKAEIIKRAKGTKEVHIIVCSEVYNLDVYTTTGMYNLHSGDSVNLRADLSSERWNEEGYCEPNDVSGIEPVWTAAAEDGETVSVTKGETEGEYTITAPPKTDDMDYTINVQVQAKVDGNEVASADRDLYVRKEYFELEPAILEGAEDLWPGESIEVTPKVVFYEKGQEPVEKTDYKFYFDYGENFEVTDSSGTSVSAGGEAFEDSLQESGTFTIKRLENSDDRVRIEAHELVTDDSGSRYEYRCDREWWFWRKDCGNIDITDNREDPHDWLFADDREGADESENEVGGFTLQIERPADSCTVEWELGFGDDDGEGTFDHYANRNTYNVGSEKNEFILINAKALKADIHEQLGNADEYVGFNLCAKIMSGGVQIDRRDRWIDIKPPVYDLEDSSEQDVLPGLAYVYDQGKMRCNVESKQYPYGDELEVEIVSLTVQNEQPDEGSEAPVFRIETDEENDDGTILVYAQGFGSAELVYRLRFPSGEEKTFTLEKYVSSDIYRFDVESSTGTTELLPGASLDLKATVWHSTYDSVSESRDWEVVDPGEYEVVYGADGYDTNLILVNGKTVTAKEEYGETWLNARLSVKRAGEPYIRDGGISIRVTDEYWQVSAKDMYAEPGSFVDAIDWVWKTYDLKHKDGLAETEGISYSLEIDRDMDGAKWITVNGAGTGLIIDKDAPDGTEVEIELVAVKEKEDITLRTAFLVKVCRHDFKQTDIVEATCAEAGSRTLTCSKCGTKKTEEIPKTGKHTAGAWETTKPATATEAGEQVQKCTVCHEVLDTKVIPATGVVPDGQHRHTAGAWVTTKQPTCTAAGTREQRCACGEVMATEAVPATGHSFGEWKETKKATVLQEGTRTRTCTVCGAAETEKTAKVKAVIKLNVKSIPLQVKKSTTAVKVVSMAEGDSVKSWKSSNPKIASVTKKGKITGKKAGTAKITVTLQSGASAKVTVKVQKKAVTTKKLSVAGKSVKKNKVTLKKGKSVTLTVTKNPITSTDKVTFKTSDKKVAVVTNKGKITAKKAGKAKITVQAGKKKVTVTVTVKK